VPIILNVHFAHNVPKLGRCLKLGHALRRAIRSFTGFKRVALMASGGLTHFVIDEELDQKVLAAMSKGDEQALASLPESVFKVGTAEIKNWLPVVAAMNDEGKKFHQVDYVPCYRSEAGTGNAMAFVYWE
jgi:Catalytic LigB subunit of aromatic ring-opening dioxygenase